MPTILRKNGYRFFFYSGEGNEPPHIHVIGKGGEMKLWLEPVKISRVYGYKSQEQKEVLKITLEHVKIFIEGWRKFHG